MKKKRIRINHRQRRYTGDSMTTSVLFYPLGWVGTRWGTLWTNKNLRYTEETSEKIYLSPFPLDIPALTDREI
jgi:hypothetical protein